jgi:hypothetical protein
MPTAPRNTATPEGMLEVASQGFQGSPEAGNAILKQEADGQRSFTTSDTLPTDMGADDRKVLEQAGVVFGDKVSGDEMFTYVTLPAGWKKVATSHSMWSNLVDDKGRTRASMFYKAAFYDRSAHLHTNRRFGIGMDYDRSDKGIIVKFVTDGETKVFTTKEYPYTGEQYREDYKAQDSAATDEVTAWLEEHYPNWEDASAYWD